MTVRRRNRRRPRPCTTSRATAPSKSCPIATGLADFDRIVPHYFQSLDRKMQHLNDQGFVPMLETIRRDVAPPWKAYFNFNESFSPFRAVHGGALRRIQLRIQQSPLRYLPEELQHHRRRVQRSAELPLPKVRAHAVRTAGDRADRPLHRGHLRHMPIRRPGSPCTPPATSRATTESTPPSSGSSGFHRHIPPSISSPTTRGGCIRTTVVAGERPQPDTDRDNYFARAQMYGCVLSGATRGPCPRHRGLRHHRRYRTCRHAAVLLAGAAVPVRGLHGAARATS